MRRTYAYFISLLIIFISSLDSTLAQDTIPIPLKIKVGLEVSGPVIYLIEKNNLNVEGYISADINEKVSVVLGGGYLDYQYSQYNYEYFNKGAFIRTGVDLNLLKPEKSMGKYWVGIGLRYGLSVFNSEIPSFHHENYWGTSYSSIAQKTSWGHFVEVSPGVRAEVFKNISIGWTISMRMLLYTGTGKELRPIYFPGFGNGTKTISTGINYFIVWNIPFKKINVIVKKEVSEDTGEPNKVQ
jgi:hypothetical protein